jgi:hypothetical protein
MNHRLQKEIPKLHGLPAHPKGAKLKTLNKPNGQLLFIFYHLDFLYNISKVVSIMSRPGRIRFNPSRGKSSGSPKLSSPVVSPPMATHMEKNPDKSNADLYNHYDEDFNKTISDMFNPFMWMGSCCGSFMGWWSPSSDRDANYRVAVLVLGVACFLLAFFANLSAIGAQIYIPVWMWPIALGLLIIFFVLLILSIANADYYTPIARSSGKRMEVNYRYNYLEDRRFPLVASALGVFANGIAFVNLIWWYYINNIRSETDFLAAIGNSYSPIGYGNVMSIVCVIEYVYIMALGILMAQSFSYEQLLDLIRITNRKSRNVDLSIDDLVE